MHRENAPKDEAFRIYTAHVGIGRATIDNFEDAYQGQYETREAFAKHLIEVTDSVPLTLRKFIDTRRYADELFVYTYWEFKGHVFAK